MDGKDHSRTTWALSSAMMIVLSAGGAFANPMQPVSAPNGTIAGTIDGHTFDLPVQCVLFADVLNISSHDRQISNVVTTGGVEPAVNLTGGEYGFQFVAFIGGAHYKFLRTGKKIEEYPYTISRSVRAGEHGKVDVDMVIDCEEVLQ